MERELTQKRREFILAGKAIFTIRNEQTGNRFTYKVSQAIDERMGTPEKQDLYFIGLLSGPENESHYSYIGTMTHEMRPRLTSKSRVTEDAQSWKAFVWFMQHIDHLPGFVKMYHAGHCGRCGRTLTVPESIESGFGPECIMLLAA